MDSYISVIRTSFVFFPFIAFLFTLPYILYNYHKYGSVFGLRIVIVYSFILYLMTIFFLVSLPLPTYDYVAHLTTPRAQLVPFHFVSDILKDAHVIWDDPHTWITLIKNQAFYQVAFNILMTMPFGMYLRYYFKCSWQKTLLLSFLLSLFFELSQLSGLFFLYPRSYRLFDVDDLMANTLGGVLGWWVIRPFLYILPKRKAIDHASYVRGEKISVLRRLSALFVDGCCLMLITGILAFYSGQFAARDVFVQMGIASVLLLWVMPLLFKGRTPGMLVTSTRLVQADPGACGVSDARLWQVLLRYVLLLGFVWGIPWLMQSGLDAIAGFLPAGMHGALYMLLLLVYGCGWIQMGFCRLSGHLPFYGRLSRTRLVSAIRVPK